MSHKIDLTAVTRISIPFLLTTLVVALSGCAGLGIGTGSEPGPFVTGGYQGNETLAVLLPKSGRFARPAEVIRAGIIAAQAADPQEKRPELRFYDSAAGPIHALVQKAAADGASLAIGPLQKPTVAKLADSSALPIPVLALNQTATAKPPNLYQFSLAPEGEAAEIADKAWNKGHRKAVLLYPRGRWGDRVSRAFFRQWKVRGGSVVAVQTFNPSSAHFSGMVGRLSKRATGADFMFLVADAKSVRRIWPLIRSKLGSKVPVYATSHIYSGRLDPGRDKNLLGLNFVEIPWLVAPAQNDAVSPAGLKKLPRLYAMGVDAYRLGSRLDWMSDNPRARVQGKTGILSMDSLGRIHRKLTLARISAASPTRLALIDQEKLGD